MRPAYFATAATLAISLILSVPCFAMDLDSFMGEINVTAHADLGRFRADLRASFGVSSREVDDLFEICDSPADVYMTLRIGKVAEVSIDRVVAEYRANKGHGWGVIAKRLGIKPGSPEFHALKQGWPDGHTGGDSPGQGAKGNGSNKAKNRS